MPKRTAIGEAFVTSDGMVRYRVRAETEPDVEADLYVVGDAVDEVPLGEFLDAGWDLRGALQNPGDRAEILAGE